MFKYIIIVFASILFMIAPVYAQQSEGSESRPAVQEPVDQVEGVSDNREKGNSLAEGMVSLDFRDADIKDVLRILSLKSGVNIVAGPEVTGLVTIQLENVSWQRALDVVLQTYGYAYDHQDNIITVTTIENLKKRREDVMLLSEQEPLVTKAFVLNYAKAVDIINAVEKMKTERGAINYDERTNSIIVRDAASNVEMIGEIVRQLDATTPQVLIEAKIIETQLGNTDKLGIDWSTEISAQGASWSTTWPFTRVVSNKNLLAEIPATTVSEAPFTYGTLNFNAFQATLQMLESRNDTNTLSNPRLVTLDNQPARIVVGTQYPFPAYTYNEEQGQMQVSGWEYKDIGVIFEVTPHVNNAGMVTLDLKPRVTAIIDDATVQVEGTTVPQLTTREASTSVMIKDGETLVIGGLISNTKTDNESKFPILGDIPLIGRLFRYDSKVNTKTDLLIFLTPHIITPEGYSEE
ncbi:MAG: type IV pilus secretin PilQ [Candidatus Omnitrophota bacterium]